MQSMKLTFEGSRGDTLAARLETPVGEEPLAYALFAHCFTCSKDLKAAVTLTRALTERRIAVLRFDFTGLGESEGDFADTSFSSNVEDLVAAAGFLEREFQAPELLVGHSLGGAAVLQAAGRVPASRAVATIGAPADPSHVKRHLTGSLDEIQREGEAEVLLAGRPFRISRKFVEDLEAARMEETVRDLDRALLLFHSPVDRIVGVDNAARIYGWAKHPKSFVSLHRADHLLMERADARYVAAVLAAWAGRYLEGSVGEEDGEPVDRPWASGEDRVAARIGTEKFRTEIMAGGHPLVADEPASVGGGDAGPTPYDLLNAALGACTVMTLRMYADRKGWPLEEAVVELEHGKVHADDDRRCEESASKLDRIVRRLRLEGELDDEQRRRLLEIAGKCPVHRTLEAGVVTETELARG